MDGIEASKQLKARYCRFQDTEDWDGFRRILADDVLGIRPVRAAA